MCCDLQMLSVQVPGCAGMERLGAPGGPRLRHHHTALSSFQPPPNKCVSDVPEWAGAGDAAGGRRGGSKKDGLLQKATRWWVRMGARPPAALLPRAPPPCVMVPRRAPPSPPPDA
ncbi:unnamed protein product [Leptidea sinapis]|uniref:Uncharacterized protein n=1 Tax=Leptidea sinapis TaxID=189913 RepID=A0A5E4PP36_9NEOP|nr:unnamed protein product [Leptidea sinapis]